MQPATRYVSVDGARVAYQVFGEGPTTLLISAGSFSHTDVVWEDPATALFLTRLGSFTRVIRYDRLGVSNSDPLPAGWTPSHDAFRAELEAVADAAGAAEFVLMAMLDAGPFAICYDAHPRRPSGRLRGDPRRTGPVPGHPHPRRALRRAPGERRADVLGDARPRARHDPAVRRDRLAAVARAEIATILFTDIVRSTERAGSLGDRDWSAVVAAHREVAAGAVEGQGGQVVKWTGDGVLALFGDPDAAVASATDLSLRARSMGVPVRCGLHTGRVERTADDVTGLAIHIAARVMHAAGADEVVVSRTVHDLMLGTGHRFRDLGRHPLKGVDGEWELYALDA